MKTVLITTSGTGSRLGEITSFTNKSLVPVGDKLAICYVIESYDIDTEFVVTLGHKGHLVREFLSLAYPSHHIQYVDVDRYEGSGSSLLYSILQAKHLLQKPFIYHCCDTFTTIPILFSEENTLVVSKSTEIASYSSIQAIENNVSKMCSKGHKGNDLCYLGIAYFKDFSLFWKEANHLYNERPADSSLSDVHCIQGMIEKLSLFQYIEVPKFYDTGNVESYKQCLEAFDPQFDVLPKNNESLCFFPDRVIKFQADSVINKKRYERGLILQPHVPRILHATDHFIEMEFVKGVPLSKSLTYGDIEKLLEWSQIHLWNKKKISNDFQKECIDFYIEKTYKRLSQLKLSYPERNNVNDINIGTVYDLLRNVDVNILKTSSFSYFHGDFILDNIIKKKMIHSHY